ncbi:MAG TPA: DUF4192 family protein [Actinomycetaceae bacterium]|nr:DUF4192 family protein [Actinomycetaceae bacterium]
MILAESWSAAFEAIASVPFNFGFVPEDSAVVAALRVGDGKLTLGPATRIDVTALPLAQKDPEALRFVLARIARVFPEGALVAVWSEKHGEDAVGLLEDVRQTFNPTWTFEHHFGYFLITSEGILGMGADGEIWGRRDALELAVTRIAMSHDACSLPRGEEALRVERDPASEITEAVARARDDSAGRAWDSEMSRELTARFVRSVSEGGTADPECQGALSHALTRLDFRDGFLAWVLNGMPHVTDFSEAPVEAWLTAAENQPPRPAIRAAQKVLADVARHQRPGQAAPELACGAYLAWFSGDGSRPRVLMTQALGEDPEYSLALLVRDALAAALPPPWVDTDDAVA